MIKTLAPLVIAVCASDSSVVSLPCAFCTENCDGGRPAPVSAWVRYGASNSVYRAEVTVSGKITATSPLPAAASGFSVDIADMVRSNWLTDIDTDPAGGLELPLAGALVPAEELLQAAAARHKASVTNTATGYLIENSCLAFLLC